MTGPEHYAEAERLPMKRAMFDGLSDEVECGYEGTVAVAQVHATLAAAAATIDAQQPDSIRYRDWAVAVQRKSMAES